MPWDRYVIPTRLKLTDYQLFSSSTTYTLPATHKFAIAEVICAGGGGTNGASLYTAATEGKLPKPAGYTANGGYGGGGGMFSRFWFPTDNSLTIVLTVGAGGAGTASQSGNQGGQTKLSLYNTVTTQTTTYILPGGTTSTGGGFVATNVQSQHGNSPSNLLNNPGGAPGTDGVSGQKSQFGGGGGGTGFMYGTSDATSGGSSENTRTAAAGNETNLTYLTGGGGAGAGASAAAGSNGSLAGSGGGGGGNGTGGTTGFAGGNGVYPGGGGGGGGPRSWETSGVTYYPTAAGGTGGGAQIKLWIYG